MASLNKIMGIGNLGRDPEIRQMPNGDKVGSVSVAITEKFKDKQGQSKEVTEWVNLTLFRRQAEIAQEYLRKGSTIYFEGKLKTDSWESNGEKKYKTSVVVSNFQMLGGKQQIQQQTPAQDFGDAPPAYQDQELPF